MKTGRRAKECADKPKTKNCTGERQTRENEKGSTAGKMKAREVVIRREMVKADTKTEKMNSVPGGVQVQTNTEQKFHKQQ